MVGTILELNQIRLSRQGVKFDKHWYLRFVVPTMLSYAVLYAYYSAVCEPAYPDGAGWFVNVLGFCAIALSSRLVLHEASERVGCW